MAVVDGYSVRKCKWDGVRQVMVYAYPIGVVLAIIRFIANAFGLILIVLIACRADNVITTNFYVVIGMPVYVIGALIILDFIFTGLAVAFVKVKADNSGNNNNNNNEVHTSQCNNNNEVNRTADYNAEGVQENNAEASNHIDNNNNNTTTDTANATNNAAYPT